MKYNKTFNVLAAGAAVAALLLSVPAFAQTNEPTSASVNATVRTRVSEPSVRTGAALRASTTVRANASSSADRIAQFKAKADQEISRRVTALTQLGTSISSMKRVSSSDKASLTSSIQTQISLMATLKAKIDAETTVDALKTDIKSITSSYRIFLLVIPQGHIMAAADRALDISALAADISTRLDAKITAAQTAGKDVSALKTMLGDLNAKAADAKVQAQAAVDLVSGLAPDGGDKTKMESNKQSLIAARAKIQAASKDLEAMRKDIKSIIAGLKGSSGHPTTTGTTTVSATAGPGARCGGNMQGALRCGEGYSCQPAPGSHLPVGDVGGVCVANQ